MPFSPFHRDTFSVCLLVSLLTTVTLAQVETTSAQINPAGVSPAPTLAPGYRSPAQVFKRQIQTTQTCGTVIGATDPAYCNPGWFCAFSTAQSAFGCCSITASGDPNNCQLQTTCADYQDVPAPKDKQAATHYCDDSDYPYCAVITGSGMSAFWCDMSTSKTYQMTWFLDSTSTSPSITHIQTSSSSYEKPTLTGAVGDETDSASYTRSQSSGTATTAEVSTSGTSGGLTSSKSVVYTQTLALLVFLVILSL